MDLIYITGAPATGKSTLMAQITKGCERQPRSGPPAHDVLTTHGGIVGAELGVRRERYSGTDALPLNIQPRALTWLAQMPYRVVLGEGQRLGNYGFLSEAMNTGYRVTLIHLVADEVTLDARRAERGSAQDPRWMKGASTQAANLARQCSGDGRITVVELDAALPLETLLEQLNVYLPVLAKLGDHETYGSSSGAA
jgi:hypothetical protein